VAIEARDVEKSFFIPLELQTTLKERMVHPSRWLRTEGERLHALRGVSFDVHAGEFFGVIGRNGSGKSTLLKLLASIYGLDAGSVRTAGRLAPFIELGVGFNPELPALDNVVLNGVMMGLSPAEARSRFEAVIDYAELHDYTALKLKNYSSGMHVRLAFSLMLQADADILLVDEVLAVGDVAFQKKCLASLQALKRKGTTVVLVTHDVGAISKHCDRAMAIESGKVAAIGDPGAVAADYLDILFPVEDDQEIPPVNASITDAWISDKRGARVEAVTEAEPLTVNVAIRAHDSVPALNLVVELLNNPEGVTIETFQALAESQMPSLVRGQEIVVRIEVDGALKVGSYRFNVLLGVGPPERPLIPWSDTVPLRVIGSDSAPGLVKLRHAIAVDDAAAKDSA
jgi:ABC-type polysaccharide/polyol phosphate transport system ATPase subunit